MIKFKDIKMINDNNNSQCRARVINYVMNFGKPVNQQLIDWVDANFNFDNYYQTYTTLLSGITLNKTYTRQAFIQRLQQAFMQSQAMNFIQFIEQDIDTNNTVQWRGDFTVDSFVSSPHWKITSFFDSEHKLTKQVFQQQLSSPKNQSCAPPISWKDTSTFKNK